MDSLTSILKNFPEDIYTLFSQLETHALSQITEIRIRKNKPIVIYIENKPCFISEYGKLINHYTNNAVSVGEKNFNYIIDSFCNNSYHTKMQTLINGYVTTNDGSRIGVASSAVHKDGKITSVKDIDSLNIRVAREVPDCSRQILNLLYVNDTPSIIVAAAPSGGKTTFIRDLCRELSSGFNTRYRKICIIDERCEISGSFDLGLNTDVIKDFPKDKGIEMAVRTMSPDIIVCDEIGNNNEVDSIKFGMSSGVKFVVTVHASSKEDLLLRSVVSSLVSTGEFKYIVLLKNYTYDYEIYDISEDSVENGRNDNGNDIFCFPWDSDCSL